MTPNKPVIAEEARKLLTDENSKLENAMLDMVSRLADVITHNAEAMNKLVNRVDELEKLVVPQSVPKKDQKVGEYLENLLSDKSVTKVMCTYATSDAFTVGKVYPVGVDGRSSYIRSDPTSRIPEGSRHTNTTSRFEIWGQRRVKPVLDHPLQVLLAQPHVQRVKCVKSESHLWQEGKDYPVFVNTTDNMHKGVRSETGELREGSLSRFVEVMPQKEPFELTFNRPSVYSTPLGVSFKDSAKQLFAEQLRHSQFLAVTRMFMGLPTIHLIHPRSL